MRHLRPALLAAAVVAVLAPTTAHADIFVAVDVAAPAPRTDLDIAVVNASLATRVTLPASVNTTANEVHPSISSDGKRLTFERNDASAGTVRILLVDRTSGQSADLFNGFETAQSQPQTPAITPGGQVVATGGPFQIRSDARFSPALTLTNVDKFPNGPFTRGVLSLILVSTTNGQVKDPGAGGNNLFAYTEKRPTFLGRLILQQSGGGSSFPLGLPTASFGHAAIAANNPQFVLFDQQPVLGNGTLGPGDIAFRPSAVNSFVGFPTVLPAIVNSPSLDESQPAITAEGRYVAFVRHGTDGHDRLFTWDSQTQTLLNSAGVDLGAVTTRDLGNTSTFQQALLLSSAVNLAGTVTANLSKPTGVGILVQRIVGRTKILGRKAYRLKPVGRVPLGTFKAGRVRTHWNLKVDGKRLRPGRYLVTLRAVGKRAVVRELGKPKVFRVR